MDYIKPYLDFLGAHPDWSIAIVFLIAMGEALLVIGLFVPSTAVLVGAGIMVGTGHLPFWPIFAATVAGCIIGDQVSFWAGRLYGEKLKTLWPLSRYPQLLAKGEDFVREHGGKSIAIGRFVPGVKAVVPGIVGMLGMGQVLFLVVNITSGIAWSALHLVPGILIGQGLAFAGELSGRLVAMLLLLLVSVGVGGYVIRLAANGLSPYLWHGLERFSGWAAASPNPWIRRLGGVAHPDSPRAALALAFAAVAVFGVLALGALVIRYASSGSVSNADQSIYNLMKEMRSAPGDELMVTLSMLGDGVVLWVLSFTLLAWLAWRKSYRAALAAAATLIAGRLFVIVLSALSLRERPSEVTGGPELFTFAAGHATMAMLVFGILAVLASHSLGRWARSVVYAACGVLVIAIAYSRVYLGLNWLSDVVSGLLFGAVLTAIFGLVIEAVPPRRILPAGLLAAAVIAFVVAGSLHVSWAYDRAIESYAPRQKLVEQGLGQWRSFGWQQLPRRRIDLVGKTGETFLLQLVGSLDEFRLGLAEQGWSEVPRWTWKQAIPYLNPGAGLPDLPPRPTLHKGLKAKLTLVHPLSPTEREVLRAYKTDRIVLNHDRRDPVYLVSLTREALNKGFDLYAVPRLMVAKYDERKAVLATIGKSGRLYVLEQNEVNRLSQALVMTMP